MGNNMISKLCLMMMIFFILQLAAGKLSLVVGSSLGICYGIMSDNSSSSPEEVVSLCHHHKIKRLRLYEPNSKMLESLRGSGIEVLLGIRNEDIQNLAESYEKAQSWVEKYITCYWPKVCFRYIAVGNEAISGDYAPYVFLTMQNIYSALDNVGLSQHIKVSTVVGTSTMAISHPPSAAAFSLAIMKYMVPIALFLDHIHSPLLANVFPFFRFVEHPRNNSLGHALFLSPSGVLIDGENKYQNMFDQMVDAMYVSLRKAGGREVPIVVSETGWPYKGAEMYETRAIAQTYNSNLIKHVLSMNGTPMQRASNMETYLFAMFDENEKLGTSTVKRNWGLFHEDKTLVYPIKFQLKK